MTVSIPDGYRHLVEQPTFAHLATIRPDGGVQVGPMWFEFDGEALRFTHTRNRVKYRNLMQNPVMAVSIVDPADPYRHLEFRGSLTEVIPDPSAEFFVHLARRYGRPNLGPLDDAPDRVVLVMGIDKVVTHLG